MSEQHCELCGQPVRVVSTGEGTNHYEPSEQPQDQFEAWLEKLLEQETRRAKRNYSVAAYQRADLVAEILYRYRATATERQQAARALEEQLAELAHEQWAGWTEWMFEKWNETHSSGETFQARWRRQMKTPYVQLSDSEKESDRIEARKVLAILAAAARRAGIVQEAGG